MEELTDEQLLERYYHGETVAFDVFFERHVGRVSGYAFKKGVPRHDVGDVAQLVFEKLHRKIHQYRRGEPALPWFFSIVHSTCMDWHRSEKRQSKIIAEVVSSSVNEPAPDEVAIDLSALSGDQQEVVKMRLREMSFKEISQITGKSEASLRKSYERSVAILKRSSQGGRND